jgi:hypothetical protein
MLCANIIIRRQIYDGLVNFLLRCCFEDVGEGGTSEADALFKFKLFLELFESFGTRETALIAGGWRHLSRSMSECVGNLSNADFASLEASQLAVLFGVMSGASKQCVPEARVNELFVVAAQLYTSPYVDRMQQRRVVSFVQNSVNFLHKICLVGSTPSSGSKWLFGADYSGGADIVLAKLGTCGGGMVDFSCFLLRTVLDFTAVDVTGSARTEEQIETVSDFLKHLDMLCQLLELSFTCMGDFSVAFASKIFTSALSLLKHATATLESVVLENDQQKHPFAVLFHLITISKLLQAMNKLQLLHSQMCGESSTVGHSFLRLYELQVAESQFAETVKNAVLAVSKVGSISVTDYQATVLIMKTHALTLDTTTTSPISFSESILEEYPQYGRYIDASLLNTWTALSAGLKLLQHCEEAQQSDIAMSTAIALLTTAIEHLDLAAVTTVPFIFNSCRLLMQRTQELFSVPDHASQRCEVTKLVGRMVEVAWTAVMSDEDMDYVTIQMFILLAFDTASLQLLETSMQQVLYYCKLCHNSCLVYIF